MILQLENISKTYQAGGGREVRAADGLSLALNAGDFIAVQGPSGGGKTTLMLIAGGLLAPDAGKAIVNGQDPYALSGDERARFRAANIGFVFQQFHLVPYLSVFDNVLAPSLANGKSGARQRAEQLIAHFGLQDRSDHVPGKLSTGERQRTALARALLNQPKLLLADEPTGNLDRDNAQAVLGYLREFAQKGGAVLLVTHDDQAAKCAQRIVRIRNGKIEAPPAATTSAAI